MKSTAKGSLYSSVQATKLDWLFYTPKYSTSFLQLTAWNQDWQESSIGAVWSLRNWSTCAPQWSTSALQWSNETLLWDTWSPLRSAGALLEIRCTLQWEAPWHWSGKEARNPSTQLAEWDSSMQTLTVTHTPTAWSYSRLVFWYRTTGG